MKEFFNHGARFKPHSNFTVERSKAEFLLSFLFFCLLYPIRSVFDGTCFVWSFHIFKPFADALGGLCFVIEALSGCLHI